MIDIYRKFLKGFHSLNLNQFFKSLKKCKYIATDFMIDIYRKFLKGFHSLNLNQFFKSLKNVNILLLILW